MRFISRPNNGSDVDNGGIFFYDWQIYVAFIGFILALIIIIVSASINISVYNKAKRTKSNVLQRDLFDALAIKTGMGNLTLHYGQLKVKNNHFNYRPKLGQLHLSRWYERTNTLKGSMLMLYNFTNILDVRKQATNFWSKSIYCHIFAGLGEILCLVSYPAFRFCDYGALKVYNLSWLFFGLSVWGTVFIIISWIWWNAIFKKLNVKLISLMEGCFPEREKAQMKKLFGMQAIVPFTVNNFMKCPRELDKESIKNSKEPKQKNNVKQDKKQKNKKQNSTEQV